MVLVGAAGGVGAGADETLASALSGGGALGLKGCCVGGFSAVVSGAGYLAAWRRAGGSSSVHAGRENAMRNASKSHNFIILLDEIYTASISMPVGQESQLIFQKLIVRPFPILLKPWSPPGKS